MDKYLRKTPKKKIIQVSFFSSSSSFFFFFFFSFFSCFFFLYCYYHYYDYIRAGGASWKMTPQIPRRRHPPLLSLSTPILSPFPHCPLPTTTFQNSREQQDTIYRTEITNKYKSIKNDAAPVTAVAEAEAEAAEPATTAVVPASAPEAPGADDPRNGQLIVVAVTNSLSPS